MRDVNSLIRLPELVGSMRELSAELVKADIIEEMVGETLPEEGPGEIEDEAAQADIDSVLREILEGMVSTSLKLPAAPLADGPESIAAKPEEVGTEEEEDTQQTMDEMRDRLEALRS